MIEFIIELLLEVFGEALIQIAFESVAEAISQLFGRTRTEGRAASTVRAVAGYALLGLVFGGLSVVVVSHSLMHSQVGRFAALLLAPIASGLAMVQLGRLRARRGKSSSELTRFGYGYTFALAMAIVRFFFAL